MIDLLQCTTCARAAMGNPDDPPPCGLGSTSEPLNSKQATIEEALGNLDRAVIDWSAVAPS